jgi:hypothetical protein
VACVSAFLDGCGETHRPIGEGRVECASDTGALDGLLEQFDRVTNDNEALPVLKQRVATPVASVATVAAAGCHLDESADAHGQGPR